MNTTENIVTLYRRYRDLTLWGALSRNFDFETDYKAYDALVRGDVEKMRDAVSTRQAAVGKPDFKNSKKANPRGEARRRIDAAMLRAAAGVK